MEVSPEYFPLFLFHPILIDVFIKTFLVENELCLFIKLFLDII